MMRYAMVVAAGLVLAACGGGERPATSEGAAATQSVAVPAEVQTALAVASAIQAAPQRADSILAAHGLTAAGFDSLMYRIAGDSALRAAFNAARQ